MYSKTIFYNWPEKEKKFHGKYKLKKFIPTKQAL